MEHHIKSWPEQFKAVDAEVKHHEVRVSDRPYHVDDVLVLHEWEPKPCTYTGRTLRVLVTWITRQNTFGLPPNVCVMSVEKLGAVKCTDCKTPDQCDTMMKCCK